MSNLVRQYYVVEQSSKARIINSNRQVELRLKELREAQQKAEQKTAEEQTDGFVDGILADVVEEINKPNSETAANEMLENARAEADSIISEAKANANSILEEAKSQIDAIFEEKRIEGYNEGLREKENELIHRSQEIENELICKKSELEEEYKRYTEELESDIVDAVIKVFNKVFTVQFDDKKELLLSLVKSTISNIEIEKSFKIRISGENYSFVKSHLDEIRSRVGDDIEIEVVNDSRMRESDCQLETNFGIFDCGIDMEMANLEKAIRSLCN